MRIDIVELAHVDEETDTRGEIDADVVPVDDGEREGLPETRGEADPLVDPDDDGERDARADTSALKVPVPLDDTSDTRVARGVPETAAVDEAIADSVCVSDDTGETDADPDGESVTDADEVGEGVEDGDFVHKGDCEEDLDARGLDETLGDALTRTLGVVERDDVEVDVLTLVVADTVSLLEPALDAVPHFETTGDDDSAIERDGVGQDVPDGDSDVDTVQLLVARIVPDTDADVDGEPDADGDRDGGGDRESVFVVDVDMDTRGDRECEPLTETEGVHDRVGGGVELTSGERDTVEHLETGALAVADAVVDAFALPVDRQLGDIVFDEDVVKLTVAVALGHCDIVADWAADRDADTLRVMLNVAEDDDDELIDRDTRFESVAGSVTDTVIACVAVSSADKLYVAD